MRNKAAEKAKHGLPGTLSPVSAATSVISHAPAAPHDTPLQRPGSYSINGILGIPPHTDPNGNINKRKRDDSGKYKLRPLLSSFLESASDMCYFFLMSMLRVVTDAFTHLKMHAYLFIE